MSERRDVAVIGGGLVGCLVARSLSSAGFRVRLLERAGELGTEASTAAAGMLAPLMEQTEGSLGVDSPDEEAMMALCLEAVDQYAAFVDAIESEVDLTVHYRPHGTLVAILDDEESPGLESSAARYVAKGLAAEFLSGDEARRLEPALSPDVAAGMLLPDDHRIDNVALMKAAAELVERDPRIDVRTRARVESVIEQEGRVSAVRVEGRRFDVSAVVVAAGCWSGEVEGLPRPLPVFPVKGQMLELEVGAGIEERTLAGPGVYLVPRHEGRVLVGATVEDAGFDQSVDPGAALRLHGAAATLVPRLEEAALCRHWAGLRPGTPDGLPILGSDPELDGLVYATGHYRNGILLAPLTARVTAAVMTGGSPSVDLSPFSVSRFSGTRGPRENPHFRAT